MGTIIRLSFIEMRKKKILYVVLLLTAIFLGFYSLILHYVYREIAIGDSNPVKHVVISAQLLSMGIYGIGFITAFFSIFTSVGAISSEIEQGGYDAVLSKPIARYEIILGKYIGILSVILIYVTLLFASVILVNIFFGREVVHNFSTLSLFKSLLFFYLLPSILVAIGLLLSVHFSTIAAGTIIVILYFCGTIGGIVEQIATVMTNPSTKSALMNIGIVTSLIIPTDIIYRKASSLLFTTSSGMNFSIESILSGEKVNQPSGVMIGYIVVYVVVMVGLALRKFSKRDL